MKLKHQFVVRQVAGEYVAVPFGKSSQELSAMIQLNETGAAIFEILNKGETTREVIVAVLQERYPIDEATAAMAVDAILEQLRSSELLDEN